MDNIRTCIETLFLQVNSFTILSHLREAEGAYPGTLGVDEEMFCRKFMVDNKCYTLDQVHELFFLFKTEWARWPLPHERAMHPESCLFYILLHYTQGMLMEQDGKPVCRYSQLLRWRMLAYKLGEDLLTTSFLAFKDWQELHKRKSFHWPSVIGQDNPAINHILGKGVTDLHFHLRGSSLNYELNWIALMNQIRNRRKAFAELRKCLSYRTSTLDNEKWNTFYLSTMKACLIRYYLFCILTGHEEESDVMNLLAADDDVLIQSDLQKLITAARYENPECLDYASLPLRHTVSKTDLVLSGERKLLYKMFYRIYSGASSHVEQILFYAYLLQKAQIRRELIHLNEREGFGNFSGYEHRKEIFIENTQRYRRLVPKLAVDAAFSQGNLKYLECRITPKGSSREISQVIGSLDRLIQEKTDVGRHEKKYFYILHFIKRPDDRDRCTRGDDTPYIQCRHYHLRKDIRKQCLATLEALRRYPVLRDRIIGIDAANTELYCRPEVFGPVYRYMKRFDGKHSKNAPSLRYTFHVGEDFWDITDGLRAIDEAILFLNLDANDRLGHALALGTDVKAYYRFRNYRVVMSKQNAMDNAVWLVFKAKELGIMLPSGVVQELQRTFHRYYDEIYLGCKHKERSEYLETDVYDRERELMMQGRDMYVYYQSWTLRGDDPEFIRTSPQNETLWDLTARNLCNEDVIQARNHNAAQYLLYCYHHNKHIRRTGNEKCEVILMPEIITLIEEVQHRMCHKIAQLHLGIEANITSNLFIGSMNKYIQHPIVKLYQHGLHANDIYETCPQLSVSVNTDDRGVFDTSIEEEYALVALALEKERDYNGRFRYQPRYIYEWLNHIREMGFEQRFRKENAEK